MALTDLFVRKTKHSGKSSGDKHSDGRALYLLVQSSNKHKEAMPSGIGHIRQGKRDGIDSATLIGSAISVFKD